MAERVYPQAGGGGAAGPDTSTDEGVARFKGTTGNTLESSGVKIDDSDNVTGIVGLTVGGFAYFLGDMQIDGDLLINGTTTTVNATNLEVTDKQITVNSGGTAATAGGSGLSVEGDGSSLAEIAYSAAAVSKWTLGAAGDLSEVITKDHAQSFSNKSIGPSNDITVEVGSFVVQDDVDSTRKGAFGAANVTSLVTRILQFPDLDGTIALTGGAQTFSGKTFDGSNIFSLNDANFEIYSDIEVTSKFGFDVSGVDAGTKVTLYVPYEDGEILTDTGAQFVDNKMIGSSNIIKGSDINFALQNNADPSKQAMFNTGNISSATTRVMTVPNADGVLLYESFAQTVENKTLEPSNTFKLATDTAKFEDPADASKKLDFDLSGLSAATTVTLTPPDVGGVILTEDGSQTLENKVLDLSNTYNLREDNLAIFNENDVTKFFMFTCENFPTDTSVLLTVPAADGTLVLESATQTLTNKTLEGDIVSDALGFSDQASFPAAPGAGELDITAVGGRLYKQDSSGIRRSLESKEQAGNKFEDPDSSYGWSRSGGTLVFGTQSGGSNLPQASKGKALFITGASTTEDLQSFHVLDDIELNSEIEISFYANNLASGSAYRVSVTEYTADDYSTGAFSLDLTKTTIDSGLNKFSASFQSTSAKYIKVCIRDVSAAASIYVSGLYLGLKQASGSSSSGSGTGAKNYFAYPNSAVNWQDDGASVETTTEVSELPEESIGTGILFSSIGDTFNDTLVLDSNDLNRLLSLSFSAKYANTDLGQWSLAITAYELPSDLAFDTNGVDLPLVENCKGILTSYSFSSPWKYLKVTLNKTASYDLYTNSWFLGSAPPVFVPAIGEEKTTADVAISDFSNVGGTTALNSSSRIYYKRDLNILRFRYKFIFSGTGSGASAFIFNLASWLSDTLGLTARSLGGISGYHQASGFLAGSGGVGLQGVYNSSGLNISWYGPSETNAIQGNDIGTSAGQYAELEGELSVRIEEWEDSNYVITADDAVKANSRFFATNLTGQAVNTGTTIVSFTTVQENIGGNYNPSNYRYTADKTGLHIFSAGCLVSSATVDQIYFVKNSGDAYGRVRDGSGGTSSLGTTAIIPMAVGDYVDFRLVADGAGTLNNAENFFAGGYWAEFSAGAPVGVEKATKTSAGLVKAGKQHVYYYGFNNTYSFVSGDNLYTSGASSSTGSGVVSGWSSSSAAKITAIVDCELNIDWNFWVDATGKNYLQIWKNDTTIISSSSSIAANDRGMLTANIILQAGDFVTFRLDLGNPRDVAETVQLNAVATVLPN